MAHAGDSPRTPKHWPPCSGAWPPSAPATADELVWLVEHPPLYTAGTSARPEQLIEPGRLPTFAAGRGGQWTYHGPGQRTAYVMLDLNRPHGTVPARDVRCFVHALEEWLIRALSRFDVRGERREGRVGIWVARIKPDGLRRRRSRAIGVRVTRWVSWHGVALNVEPDLDHYARHRAVRHQRARRHQPACARAPGDNGGSRRRAARGLG